MDRKKRSTPAASTPKAAAASKTRKPRKRAAKKLGVGPAPAAYEAKRGDTPARPTLRRPSIQQEQLLPFVDIGSVNFEHLCRDLAKPGFPDIVVRTSLKRDRGQQQFGVDVEGFDENDNSAVVISAKCYHDVNAWDFKPWIEDFTRHLDDHWKDKGIKHFVLAVTHETNDDGMNEAAKEAVAALRERGIRFHLWNTYELSRMMRDDAHLVERYFHRHWADALSARRRPIGATSIVSGRARDTADLMAVLQGVTVLEDGLDAALTSDLDAVLKAVRSGRPSRLREWFERVRASDDHWQRIDVRIRGKALRAFARLEIDAGRLDGAADLLDQADDLSPAPDRSVRALLAYVQGRTDDALALLSGKSTSPERELNIGILIETGHQDEAREALAILQGNDVTPEILRLRSILNLLEDRLDEALADAFSAAERAPESIRCLTMLARVRFHRALARGFKPCLDRVPDPIPIEMVRSGSIARDDLSSAADLFGQACAMSEGDARRDLEIWMLATALLHPGRATEASRMAKDLLSGTLPDATAVAWCLVHDRITQPGQLRRTIGNAIRNGSATAGHLVVFALLCSGPDRPHRAERIIRHHAPLFPEAIRFLEDWRTRLGSAEAEGTDELFRAIGAAREGGDLAPILDLATKAQDAQTVFAAGELLSSLREWPALSELGPALLATGTHRGIQLAAFSLLRSDDPAGCLEVLEKGRSAFEGGLLPPSLIHLRVSANEHLGRYEPVLADLLSLRRDGDDKVLRARIIDTYERLGDLENLSHETDKALELGVIDPYRAIRVAGTLRLDAPETARRALLFASEAAPPVELAGAILGLAQELGLAELQSQTMRRLLTHPDAGGHTLRFDSVEDVIAYMDERSREGRERIAEWQRRGVPFAVATAPEIETFARMLLSSPAHRRDGRRELLPMLLRAGLPARTPAELVAGSILRLDLSALLLAERLDLLGDVEAAFRIRVPASTPEALIEMEAHFQATPPEAISALRDVLEGRSTVRLADDAPDGCLTPAEGQLDVPSGDVFAALLRRAFLAGHVGIGRIEEAGLTIDGDEEAYRDLGVGVICDHSFVLRLHSVGLLEPIARTTSLFLSKEGATMLKRVLDDAVEGNRIHALLRGLRIKLARRLSSGSWDALVASSKDGDTVGTWPPHARCLMEALRAQEREQGCLWVEDAALSGAGMPGIVGLPDVLARLCSDGSISEARRSGILNTVRSYGYGFLPVEAREVFTELKRSPASDDLTIETPEMAGLRTWFAEQTKLLRFIPMPAEIAQDRRIEGEARHTLGCLALATDVLALVWNDAGLPLNQRVRYSEWVWTTLRIDRVVDLPSDADSEARGTLRALQLSSALDLPLVRLLNGEEVDPDIWTDYLSWLANNCLDIALESDPRVRSQVLDVVGAQLAKILEVPVELSGADRERIRRHLIALVRRYLDLLPDELSMELATRCDFDAVAGRRTLTTFTLGTSGQADPIRVELTTLVASCDRAFESGARSYTERISAVDGRTVSFAADLPEGERSLSVVIRSRRQRFILDPLLAGLLPSRIEDRMIPSDERRRLLDPRGSVREADLSALIRMDGTRERLDALNLLLEGDVHHRLQSLSSRILDDGNITLDDLSLPSPTAIATYLRLHVDEDPYEQLVGSVGQLIDELGPSDAFDRIASVPIELPDEALSVLLRHDGAPQIEAGRGESPLLAIADLRRIGRQNPEIVTDAWRTLVVAITGTMPLIVALVRYFAASATESEGWSGVPKEMRIVLLWSYAELVTRTLGAPHAGAEAAADWLSERTHFPMAERLDFDRSGDWYRAATFELDPQRALANCFGLLVRDGITDRLPAELLDEVRELLGRSSNGIWMPGFPLARTTPDGPAWNWMLCDPLAADSLGRYLAPGDPTAYRNDDELACALMDFYEQAGARNVVAAALYDVDLACVSAETRDRMLRLLDTTDMGEVLSPRSGGFQKALLFEAALRSAMGDKRGISATMERLSVRFANLWRLPAFTSSERRERITASAILADAALRFAYGYRSELAERFALFGELVLIVVDAWPTARADMLRHVDMVVRTLGSQAADALWDTLLNLRGRR